MEHKYFLITFGHFFLVFCSKSKHLLRLYRISYMICAVVGLGTSWGTSWETSWKAIFRNKIRPPELARCLPVPPVFYH